MTSKFLALLDSSPLPLLADGAMGTLLNARGVDFERCFDDLNRTDPKRVAEIHRAYIAAGAQVIQTNTFGANRYKLAAHGLQNQVVEVNRAGVELARQAAERSGREVLVAGDIGPLGVRLAPYGRVQPEEARRAFAEQVTALVAAGADLLILETFSDLNELLEALAAVHHVCASLPEPLAIVASLTFTRDDRTLLGDAPREAAHRLAAAGADLIGVNCSGGPAQILRILKEMRLAEPITRFSVMPNAGWPEQAGGRIMYPANPDYFGQYARLFCEAGARLVGGCCGTTPEHIVAMRHALDREPEGCGPDFGEIELPAERGEEVEHSAAPTHLAQKLADRKFVVAVEMDPPRGLSAHKLIAGASLLAEAGADVINIADSPMARMRMSPWAVCSIIQRQFNIETVLHFPTRGRNLLRVQGDLLAAHALGIRNLFVVMGDPTAIGDYPEATDNYDLVPSGLIRLIKGSFNQGRDHAGADIGQPTAFFVGAALNLHPPDPQAEMKNLRRKLRAGADFLLTQPVFQPEEAGALLKHYAEEHGPLEIPVLVGVLPLYSSRHASFLHNEVPGIAIPAQLQNRIASAGEAAPQEGILIALELVERMRSWASGVYLMPAFNRYDMAAEVVEGINK